MDAVQSILHISRSSSFSDIVKDNIISLIDHTLNMEIFARNDDLIRHYYASMTTASSLHNKTIKRMLQNNVSRDMVPNA